MSELTAVLDLTETTIPAPPEPLGEAGEHLWREMWTSFDFEDEPGKQTILLRACKAQDTIRKLEDYAAEAPMRVKGSMGQVVLNGAYAEIRQYTNTLNNLVKSLNLPEADEESAEKAKRRSQAGKKAANARWGVL